ncbi:MAG: DUF6089 family protein [Ginsengibacter sp.]
MKLKIHFFVLFFIIVFQTNAQSYFYNDEYYDNDFIFEAGVSMGPMNCLTDIGGRKGLGKAGAKDLNINSTTFGGGIYLGAMYKHIFGLRIEATTGRVHSKDSLLEGVKKTAIGRYNRNLSFRTQIAEVSAIAEFHPLDFVRSFNLESFPPSFSPYILAGAGYFHFNPQARLYSDWVDLHPLHTEGQGFEEYPDRKEYSLNQFNLSFGVGVAYELSPKINLRIEYINRFLFTDYLDDVHDTYINPVLFSKYLNGNQLTQAVLLNNRGRPDAIPNETTAQPGSRRGNPLNNDSYFSINFKVGYIFGREKISSGNRYFRNSSRSPVRF